jgi:hypothetical protein
MLQRSATCVAVVVAAFLACARPALAQQTVNFTLGYFDPQDHGSRTSGDVLDANQRFLLFDIGEFGGASVGGEWLVGLGNFFEAGAGISYTGQSVPSVYRDFIDPDGTEIDQDLELRLVPMAFTIRLLPFGQRSPLQPYVGAGLGIINWRYRESGEFIDFNAGREIFVDTFEESGSSTGPIFVGGVRFAGRRITAGGEVRFHDAEGDLPSDFAGPKIDLGGWTYNFTVGVRF